MLSIRKCLHQNAGTAYFFRFSICPDRITGSFGSVISQDDGFVSSSLMTFTPISVCLF